MVLKNKPKERFSSIYDHLAELRIRLLICLIFVVIFTITSYCFVDRIRLFITAPVREHLVFVSLPEAFLVNLKIAALSGILVSIPVILQQLWSFVIPGLTKSERIAAFFLVVGSILFFTLGVIFAFFIIVPFTVSFFLKFSSAHLKPMITFSNYVSFVSGILFAFGIVFQLPLVVFILAQLGLISHELLSENRANAIVFIFIIAAILTPPDIISQILLAIPLLLLYEFSMLMAKLAGRKRTSISA